MRKKKLYTLKLSIRCSGKMKMSKYYYNLTRIYYIKYNYKSGYFKGSFKDINGNKFKIERTNVVSYRLDKICY